MSETKAPYTVPPATPSELAAIRGRVELRNLLANYNPAQIDCWDLLAHIDALEACIDELTDQHAMDLGGIDSLTKQLALPHAERAVVLAAVAETEAEAEARKSLKSDNTFPIPMIDVLVESAAKREAAVAAYLVARGDGVDSP